MLLIYLFFIFESNKTIFILKCMCKSLCLNVFYRLHDGNNESFNRMKRSISVMGSHFGFSVLNLIISNMLSWGFFLVFLFFLFFLCSENFLRLQKANNKHFWFQRFFLLNISIEILENGIVSSLNLQKYFNFNSH